MSFDFESASQSTCAILGEREFAILVTPEHAAPINPSPWYAFRYAATGADGIAIRLDYVGARHRYPPRLIRAGTAVRLSAEVMNDGSSARLRLPPGQGVVAGQELFPSDRYQLFVDQLTGLPLAERIELGKSLDGRPINAVRFGHRAAPRLIVFLGRQHPPEVTGAIAMETFVDEVARLVQKQPNISCNFQFVVVPNLNPDGVARGHWRANRGGKDLNRDWGRFTQPETRAVKALLDALPQGVRPVGMLDFHSTDRNLFYVQGEAETDEVQERFLTGWLNGRTASIPGYPFTVERRDARANGSAKNWFHQAYDIPAYTYEVGDQTDREAIRRSALRLAQSYVAQLNLLVRHGPKASAGGQPTCH